MRALIINADDFGRSRETNAGILRAHREGVLTSASLMVAEPGCAEAVAAARDCPGLDVGLHAVVCNGLSLLPPRQLRGLVDDAGRFPPGEVWAGLRYALRPGLRARLRDELRAQVERHLELVGYLYHINAHHNLHLHPMLAEIFVELAGEYRVPYMRLLREPVWATLSLARDHWPRKLRDHLIFLWLSGRASRKMRRRGIAGNTCTLGFHQTARMTEDYVSSVLARLPAGSITEFYFHPAERPSGNHASRSDSRAIETEILTGSAVREAIRRNGITLSTFRELARRDRGYPLKCC
ncbi:MAG: hopanoid biosynthesis-associated protein HpnK [Terriglobia bacterium]